MSRKTSRTVSTSDSSDEVGVDREGPRELWSDEGVGVRVLAGANTEWPEASTTTAEPNQRRSVYDQGQGDQQQHRHSMEEVHL